MQTIQIRERTDQSGSLSLTIPLGRPETDYDVVVIVQPNAAPASNTGDAPWAVADAIKARLAAQGIAWTNGSELVREDRDR